MTIRKRLNHDILRGVVLVIMLMAATPAVAQDLVGNWQSRGWALTVSFDDDSVALYQSTATTFLPLGELPLVGNAVQFDARTKLFFNRDGDALSLIDEKETIRIDFLPLATLPPESAFTGDAQVNFDLFVELFAENYALFELNDVNWAALAAQERVGLTAQASAADLFARLERLVAPLTDRHVSIASDDDFVQSGPQPDPFWDDNQTAIVNNVRLSHLDNALLRSVPTDNRVRYGTIGGNTLYLLLTDFSALDGPGRTIPESLDFVFDDVPDTDSLIIDLRFNGGGREANGLALVERLINRETVAYVRETRSTADGGFTPPELVPLQPTNPEALPRPAIVLTSPETASNAEKVALAGAYQPWITLAGLPTKGILSNILDLVLANGWSVGLSHQRTYSVAGEWFEQAGVPPDLEATIDADAVVAGSDPMIEAALDYLATLPHPSGSTFTVDARSNGVWFDAQRSGEGWLVDILPDGRAFVTWFTYPEPGSTEHQAWITAVGTVEGNRIVLAEAQTTHGARFGDAFDADDVQRSAWGRFDLVFESCDSGYVSYQGPAGFRAGTQRLNRLVSIDGLACSGDGSPLEPTAPGRYSGSWYDAARSGEGWMLNVFSPEAAFVAWFTYDDEGNAAWVVGNGVIDGDRIEFQMIYPRGGVFGPRFDTDAVETPAWGALVFEFTDCNTLAVTWDSVLPAFGSGKIDAVRLTQPVGVTCP